MVLRMSRKTIERKNEEASDCNQPAGAVLQAGVDIPVAKNTYLNFDIKKPYISTEVSSAGARIGTFRIDPILFGVGLGWCF